MVPVGIRHSSIASIVFQLSGVLGLCNCGGEFELQVAMILILCVVPAGSVQRCLHAMGCECTREHVRTMSMAGSDRQYVARRFKPGCIFTRWGRFGARF